jgi:lysozyme
VELVKEFEGFKAKPYLPTPNDVPTIGYGTTIRSDGRRVSLDDPAINQATATKWLREDVANTEQALARLVKVELNQNQFDALVSFAYNIDHMGVGQFKSSTLLRLVNEENFTAAAKQFPRWIYQNGNVLNGLVRRREKERALFEEVS